MRLTNMMVDHPCRVLCAAYSLLFIFAMLTLAFGYMVPVLEGGRGIEFSIWMDPLQVNYDMLTLAEEYLMDTKGDPVVD